VRKLLIAIGVIIVLLIAAVFAAPSFVDWNSFKPEIQAEVQKATGRDLKVEGDIGLSILPVPSLSVDDVSLSNMPGASRPDMVSLDALRLSVDPLALLGGEVRVTSVSLVKPVIVLETDAEGRANWDLQPAEGDTGAGGAETGSGSGDTAVAIERAVIEDGTLIYRDGVSGEEHRVDQINLEVSAGALQGPFEAEGTAAYKDLPLALAGSVGALDAGRATPIKLDLRLDEGDAVLQVQGTVDLDGGEAGPSFNGSVNAEAPDVKAAARRVTALFGEPAVLPDGVAEPGSLEAKVIGSAASVSASDLILTLGETRLQGAVEAQFGDEIAIDANLGGNRLDLDKLLAGSGPAATASASQDGGSSGAAPTAAPAALDFAIPANLSGTAELSVDAIQFNGSAIRKARLDATLAQGVLSLDLATAQLPGGTEVTVTGTVESQEGAPRFVGRAELASDNLRGTLDWAQVDLAGVPADRLRKAMLSASIDATPREVKILDGRLELDATKANGAVTLLLRERPALGFSLAVDRINLDAYMPAAAATDGTGAGGGSGGGDGATPAPAPANPLAVLDTFDANMNVTVGEATISGVPIRDARFDALLQEGTLTLRDVGIADAGGARLTVSGLLQDAAGDASVDLAFTVGVVSIERLARTLSTDVPIPPAKLGKVSLSGKAAGDMQDVTVDLQAELAGGRLGLKGSARPLTMPPTLDLDFSVDHPDANALADVLAPGALGGVGQLGAVSVTGDVSSRDDGRYAHQATVSVAGATIGSIGNFDPFQPVPDLNMAVEVNHGDAVRFIRIFAPDFKPAGGGQGPLRLRTAYRGPANQLTLEGIEIRAGGINGNGSGRIDTTGPVPSVTLDLAFDEIRVDPWLPEGAPKPQGAVPVTAPAGGSAGGGEWSREKLDLSALSSVNATITNTIQRVVYGSYVIDNADLVAKLQDGVLQVERMAGGMFGGTFNLNAEIADRPTPTASLAVKVRDADVRQAAATAAETDMVSGILTYDTELRTAGGSEFEMVSNLAGTGSFNVRDGAVDGFNLQAFSDRLKELDRTPDFVDLIDKTLAGGSTRFSRLNGSYRVENGILRSNDIVLEADAGGGNATAVVDLPPRQMDVNAELRLTEHPNSPPIGIRLFGPLDNPRQIFKTEQMQAYVLQRLVERGVLRELEKNGGSAGKAGEVLRGILGGGQSSGDQSSGGSGDGSTDSAPAQQQAPADSQPQQIKPEDAVRGILKNLLNQ